MRLRVFFCCLAAGLSFTVSVAISAAFMMASPAVAEAASVEQLSNQEVILLHSIMGFLRPLVEERKKIGTAPLLTFGELYAPLKNEQRAFLDQIRALEPGSLGGSSRKLPLPSSEDRFIRLDNQMVLRDGTTTAIDTQYLPEPAYRDYQRMMVAMEQELGKRLLVESGYRSPAYQLYLFLFYIPKHNYSIRETNRHVALPGCSEHGSPSCQAIDFITPHGINGEERIEEFEELQEYTWLINRGKEFGFHLSYPRGGPSAYEPWHWSWSRAEEKSP